MIHKVSEMCDMVETMYNESRRLMKMKYHTPKIFQNEAEINNLIAQIQYMAQLVSNDKSPYTKREEHDSSKGS